MFKRKYNISEHWDTAGLIDGNSNPLEEFKRWMSFVLESDARGETDMFNGDEFSLKDFEDYINQFETKEENE